MKRFTRAEFRDWLKAHRPDEVVGVARSAGACPLAEFTGCAVDPSTANRGILWIEANDTSRPLPKWANTFALAVDDQRGEGDPITARFALDLLDHGVPLKAGSDAE